MHRCGLGLLRSSSRPTSDDYRRQVFLKSRCPNVPVCVVCVVKERGSDANRTENTATQEQLQKQLTAAPPVTHFPMCHPYIPSFSHSVQPLKKSRKRYEVMAQPSLSAPAVGREGGERQIPLEAVNTHRQLCNDITNIEVQMYIYTNASVVFFIHAYLHSSSRLRYRGY